jgi:hypothetical protein
MADITEVEILKSKLHKAAKATETGDFDAARRIAKQILAQNAGNLAALHIYFDSTKIIKDDPIMDNLAKFCTNKKLPNPIQSQLHFMYGKGLADHGEHNAAFDAFVIANQLSEKKSNPSATSTLSRLLIENIKARNFAKLPSDGKRLIFVLGMPRSGTSIMSQSLGCHSAITSLGERVGLGQALDQAGWHGLSSDSLIPFIEGLTKENLNKIRQDYLNSIDAQGAVYVDKMPENYWFAWIIPLLFPNAQIIHMKRPPLANCWSCFRHDFKDGHHYSYNFKTMMAQYAIYSEMVEVWKKLNPKNWYDVNLEDFVVDPKQHLLPIFENMDLSWEDACLTPERSNSTVSTLSKWQVRQGLDVKISQDWQNYLPFIQKKILS